jgi:hypothetical protein
MSEIAKTPDRHMLAEAQDHCSGLERRNRKQWPGRYAMLLAAVAAAAPAAAQDRPAELRLRVETADGAPLSGALVALLTATDSVVTEALTSEDGSRMLLAPSGSYTIRVRIIGLRPYVSSISLPHDGELLLRINPEPVVLSTVVVTARSGCARPDHTAAALSTVWEEAAKALRASQLTVRDLQGVASAFTYRRSLRRKGGAVVRADTTILMIRSERPFGARDPAELAAEGYVLGDETAGWRYFAPDETILLSKEFLATHCFAVLRDRRRPEQVGVSFEPVSGRDIPEIAGVAWLDEKTSELREIVFRFVNGGTATQFEVDGFTRFRRMPSGAWLIEEWRVTMPQLTLKSTTHQDVILSGRRPLVVAGYVEEGGGIVDK